MARKRRKTTKKRKTGRRRKYLSKRKGRMVVGECRRTRQGRAYCRGPQGVRFVTNRVLAGLGFPIIGTKAAAKAAGLGRVSTKRGKMKNGECRRTRNGQKYCMTRGRVRFRKG